MRFHWPIQALILVTCVTDPFFASLVHAQTSPPWLKEVKTTFAKTAQMAAQSLTTGTANQYISSHPASSYILGDARNKTALLPTPDELRTLSTSPAAGRVL